MRELKFRAWCDTKKQFVNPTYNNVTLEDLFQINFYKYNQFIGLEDGGGNEIYENDFVKFRPNYTNKPIIESVGIVVFHYNQWMLQANNEYYSISEETDEFYCYSEVIGNIHESPELLTKTH